MGKVIYETITMWWWWFLQIHVERKYRVAFELHGSGVDEEPKGLLSINEETGIVMVHYKIDYEQYKLLKVSVPCAFEKVIFE